MVSQTETRAGEVTRVSSYGFQLNGQTRWYNLSKFVKGLALPAVGEGIEIRLDKGYVVQITKRSEPGATDPARVSASSPPIASQAPATGANTEPSVPKPDALPFESLAEPPFLDPDALPFDEPFEDIQAVSPPDGSAWEPGASGAFTSTALPDKDTQTVRTHALTTAVAILSSGGRSCDTDEVLTLAARLEAWINRTR